MRRHFIHDAVLGISSMTWGYAQRIRELTHAGEFVGTGQSGTEEGRNNLDIRDVHNVGPIPQGLYFIGLV